jgi:hypothetical protein
MTRSSSVAPLVAETVSVSDEELREARTVSPEPVKDPAHIRIPKPTGKVGHPERGGYKLRAVLSVEPTLYCDLVVCTSRHCSASTG